MMKWPPDMRILVTGGAGFIGSHFVYHTLNRHPNDSVAVLDLLTYAGHRNRLTAAELDPRCTFVEGDICNVELVNTLVRNADAVVHFAAETHVDRSVVNPDAFVRTNVLGTQVLLDACRRNGNVRFHHVSTDEVYGSLGPAGAFSETTPYNPRSPYSASKAASDHLVSAAWHTHRLPVTISSCSNNYGPSMVPEKLIPLAITNVLSGKPIPLYGDGMQVRDWLYVEDHCEGIDRILRAGRLGEKYCLGGRSERSNVEVAQTILFEMGLGEDHIKRVVDRPGHDQRYSTDPRKAETELGWRVGTPFLHGLRKTINWYRTNHAWWEPLTAGKAADPREAYRASVHLQTRSQNPRNV